jgi:ACS family D-galactonate transporter-like MFS transporter
VTPPVAITRARYGVAAMLFITVAINYLDRSNLSVAATALATELRLDPVHLGLVFSAFGWAYALSQIPGGWLVDRIAPRYLYAAVCALWSAATLLQGLARTFAVLIGLRILLGLFEAPAFPICSKLATRWFPAAERAGAIGFYTSGQFVGLAFLTPLLVLAQSRFGWHVVFFITGGLGLLWAAFWYGVYRDPANSRRLGAAERDYIRAGGGWVDEGREPASAPGPGPGPDAGAEAGAVAASPAGLRLADLQFVLSQRKLWGLYLGQFAVNAVPWFFLTWFPTYLVTYRHFDFIRSGYAASLPFLAAFCGVIGAGFFSDYLVRRGAPVSVARKTPIIAGLLISICMIGANFVTAPAAVIFFLTLAFFGNGLASITWVLVSLIAPRRLLGLTGGVFNFFGNLASVAVPLVIGFIVQRAGFDAALLFVGAIALMGALAYLVLVGEVVRLE